MSGYRKTPDAVVAANAEGFSNLTYPLYTPSQQRIQDRLARKYRLNRASAIFVADVLLAGER